MDIRSRLIVGAPGSGKSMGILGDVLQILLTMGVCIILCDPHGELGRLLVLHATELGLGRRILYDKLGSFNRVLGIVRLQQSTDSNSWVRRKENNSLIMGYLRVIWSSAQRDADAAMLNHPMTFRWVKLSLQLLLFQPEPVSLGMLTYCFMPKSVEFKDLVKNCTNRKTKTAWTYIETLAKTNSYTLLEGQLGGAQRLIETVLDMPEFAARLDGSFDIGKAILSKQIIILDGSDAEPESRTALYRAWNLMTFRFLAKHFAETGKPAPTLCIWDEAPASNVIGPMELNMLREGRKMGFAGWIAGQDLSFIDPLLKKAIKGTTPEHCWYNPADDEVAMEAAKDIGYAVLNPYLEHHRTERTIHDGYDEDTRISTSTTKLEDGDRITKSEGKTLIARHKPIADIYYTALNDQILLMTQKVMCQQPGWRLIKSPGFVTPEPVYSPMPENPYPEIAYPGLAAIKINKAIAKSQERPEFTVPVDYEMQCPETTTSTPTSGMRKSEVPLDGDRRQLNNSSEKAISKTSTPHGKGSKGSKNEGE